jgi:MFS transporter, SHS family, sialic acid transporter
MSKKVDSQKGKWMALIAAILGWLFDGFEMGLFPLAGGPALADLLKAKPGTPEVNQWFSVIYAVFLVGAATGGVLFGWLGDRIGRVKAMSLSIFAYAIFTGLCGFATEAWHIAVLRFIASLGMGGEWSLGVALVNELWPNKSRALTAGLIGAAANVGFMLVGFLSLSLSKFIGGVEKLMLGIGLSDSMVESLLGHGAWRFLMISGALPALLIFMVRLFVPESHKWEEEKKKGGTDHWATVDLMGVLIGCIGTMAIIYMWSPAASAIPGVVKILVTIIGLAVALIGYLYPVKRYLARSRASGNMTPAKEAKVIKMMLLGAGLAGVALLGTWGSIQWAAKWAGEMANDPLLHAKEYTQIWLAVGAIVGTMVAALMGDYVKRRTTYAILCIGSLLSALYLYQFNDSYGTHFLFSVFIAGGVTASFYGFFPLYLPELFPTSVRATGQGFAFNFGRIIAAIGGLQTATLTIYFGGNFAKAGSVLAGIYVVGLLVIWFCPETKGEELPE